MEDDSLSTTIFNQFRVFHILGRFIVQVSPTLPRKHRRLRIQSGTRRERGGGSGVAIVRVALPRHSSSMNSMISNKRAKSKYILACGARDAITMVPDECSYTFTWEIADPSQRKLSEVKPTILRKFRAYSIDYYS